MLDPDPDEGVLGFARRKDRDRLASRWQRSGKVVHGDEVACEIHEPNAERALIGTRPCLRQHLSGDLDRPLRLAACVFGLGQVCRREQRSARIPAKEMLFAQPFVRMHGGFEIAL